MPERWAGVLVTGFNSTKSWVVALYRTEVTRTPAWRSFFACTSPLSRNTSVSSTLGILWNEVARSATFGNARKGSFRLRRDDRLW